MTTAAGDPRRSLPAVGALLELPGIRELSTHFPGSLVTRAARETIAAVRTGHVAPPVDDEEWTTRVGDHLTQIARPSLRRVVNATGVVLHTNLGRAPLPRVAIDAIAATAAGASNLEYDLTVGARGSRYSHAVSLLTELTGAEDALVLNNCAAALVVALNTMAAGREAVISRGELIEIGGSFRVPDIMAKGGVILREVGTTNRTHVADYASAIGDATGVIVKVHRSNFEQRGFVAEATVRDLVPIAAGAGCPLLHDFGSGLLMDLSPWGLTGEPTVPEVVRDGATVVVMSGDKLLGGPQAGIMLGNREWIAKCRANPLTRAFRVDKLTLAALEATLQLYREPEVARTEIPVLAMLTASLASLQARAAGILEALPPGHGITVVDAEATVGGGAFPSARIPSAALSLPGGRGREAALRSTDTPIIGRMERDQLLLDLRSVGPADDTVVVNAITR
ncbi:MAG: L-seryl-tRNA(Sec) selenium transferase [Gemmatimonadetes bacterium]|nr:L-seryl-tRNA(Sec) selenium transferase [Gemmatimonadota bacterium]